MAPLPYPISAIQLTDSCVHLSRFLATAVNLVYRPLWQIGNRDQAIQTQVLRGKGSRGTVSVVSIETSGDSFSRARRRHFYENGSLR